MPEETHDLFEIMATTRAMRPISDQVRHRGLPAVQIILLNRTTNAPAGGWHAGGNPRPIRDHGHDPGDASDLGSSPASWSSSRPDNLAESDDERSRWRMACRRKPTTYSRSWPRPGRCVRSRIKSGIVVFQPSR